MIYYLLNEGSSLFIKKKKKTFDMGPTFILHGPTYHINQNSDFKYNFLISSGFNL